MVHEGDRPESFRTDERGNWGANNNTFTQEARALIVRPGEGLLRRTRNLCHAPNHRPVTKNPPQASQDCDGSVAKVSLTMPIGPSAQNGPVRRHYGKMLPTACSRPSKTATGPTPSQHYDASVAIGRQSTMPAWLFGQKPYDATSAILTMSIWLVTFSSQGNQNACEEMLTDSSNADFIACVSRASVCKNLFDLLLPLN